MGTRERQQNDGQSSPHQHHAVERVLFVLRRLKRSNESNTPQRTVNRHRPTGVLAKIKKQVFVKLVQHILVSDEDVLVKSF